MSRLEGFLKTASIYFLGNIFTKLISFLLLPIYTKRIAPSDFGVYGIVLSLSNLIIPLIFFQIWDSVFRFCFDYEKENDKYKVINNGMAVMLIGVLVYTLLYSAFCFIYDFDSKILVFVYSLGMGIQYFYNFITRALKDNTLFVISGCINSVLTIVLNIILIVVFHMGVEALYIASTGGVLIQIIIIEFRFKLLEGFHWNDTKLKTIKELIKFSAPLCIATISQWMLSGLTQLAIGIKIGTYGNGLFAVVNRFSSIVILLVGIFQFAWNETAYSLADNRNRIEYYRRSETEMLKITLVGSSILLLCIKMVFPFFIDKQYSEALQIVPIVFLGIMANAYAGFLDTIFLAIKQSNKIFIAILIASITNVLGLLVLIPVWGLKGAAMSLGVAFFVSSISKIIMLSKNIGIKPDKAAYNSAPLILISVMVFYKVESIYLQGIILVVLGIISAFILKPLIIILLGIGKKHLRIALKG